MENVFKAIYAAFTAGDGDANSFYTAVDGRLYNSRAPQNSAWPFAVYHLVSEVPDWVFSNEKDFRDILIQFSLFSRTNGAAEIEDMYTKLNTLYHKQSLAITGYRHLDMLRQLTTRFIDSDDIWNYAVEMMITVRETS